MPSDDVRGLRVGAAVGGEMEECRCCSVGEPPSSGVLKSPLLRSIILLSCCSLCIPQTQCWAAQNHTDEKSKVKSCSKPLVNQHIEALFLLCISMCDGACLTTSAWIVGMELEFESSEFVI